MSVVVWFCHACITYRNVDSAPHHTMGIGQCGKVYSSISASFPTGTVSTSLSPCQITSFTWNVVVSWKIFSKSPFLNDNDSALRLLSVWTCLTPPHVILFSRLKCAGTPRAQSTSAFLFLFWCRPALVVKYDTIRYNHLYEVCIVFLIFY